MEITGTMYAYSFLCLRESYKDKGKRLFIAKEFVNSAAYNIYRNLRYYNQRNKDLESSIPQAYKV